MPYKKLELRGVRDTCSLAYEHSLPTPIRKNILPIMHKGGAESKANMFALTCKPSHVRIAYLTLRHKQTVTLRACFLTYLKTHFTHLR